MTYVFIDSRMINLAALMQGLASGVQWVTLDVAEDGLGQMARALQGASDVDAIHVISHGSDGILYPGKDILTSDNLASYANELLAIGSSLTGDGDILLYGCDVAATDIGQRFIELLGSLTGAEVAASTGATGAAALGGNWLLEASTGVIEQTRLRCRATTYCST